MGDIPPVSEIPRLRVTELKDYLRALGLPTQGNKANLGIRFTDAASNIPPHPRPPAAPVEPVVPTPNPAWEQRNVVESIESPVVDPDETARNARQ